MGLLSQWKIISYQKNKEKGILGNSLCLKLKPEWRESKPCKCQQKHVQRPWGSHSLGVFAKHQGGCSEVREDSEEMRAGMWQGLIGRGEEPIIFSKSDEKPMEGFAQKNDQVQFKV